MTKEVNIWSCFSTPIDLAAELRYWQEFVRGEGYSVDLRNIVTLETVTVRLVGERENRQIIIKSSMPGELFDRVVGRVVFVMSKRTNHLKIWTSEISQPSQCKVTI